MLMVALRPCHLRKGWCPKTSRPLLSIKIPQKGQQITEPYSPNKPPSLEHHCPPTDVLFLGTGGQVLRAHRSSAATCISGAGPAPSWVAAGEKARAQEAQSQHRGRPQRASAALGLRLPTCGTQKKETCVHRALLGLNISTHHGTPGAAEGRHRAELGLRDCPATCH